MKTLGLVMESSIINADPIDPKMMLNFTRDFENLVHMYFNSSEVSTLCKLSDQETSLLTTSKTVSNNEAVPNVQSSEPLVKNIPIPTAPQTSQEAVEPKRDDAQHQQQLEIMSAINRVRELEAMLNQMRPFLESLPLIRMELDDLSGKLLNGFCNV